MDKNQLNKIKNIVEAKNMKKMMFTMEGNLCAARIRASEKGGIVIIRRLRKRIWLVRFSFWEMRT